MTSLQRTMIPLTGPAGDANIRRRHPAEAAAWVWHPGCKKNEFAILRFSLDVVHDGGDLTLHVSADERFWLSIDGVELARGPDRGDLAHWSVHSYQLALAKGAHRIEALVTWIGPQTPEAQISLRGGFLVAVDGPASAQWNTGTAPWQVERLEHAVGLAPHQFACYHAIGPRFTVDLAQWNKPVQATAAAVIEAPLADSRHGIQRNHWRLHPTRLHEQRRERGPAGKIRAKIDKPNQPFAPIREGTDATTAAWQALVEGRSSVTVPPRTSYALIWDLGIYECGYADIVVSGGAQADVICEWSESLMLAHDPAAKLPWCNVHPKGQRDAVDGKVFEGFGDTWRADGGNARSCPALWWRSGRFLKITVTTKDQALVVNQLAIRTTGHPLPIESTFASSDPTLDATQPLMTRVLQMCAHESFVDCPYYEQLLYGGDGRLEFLTHYTVTHDDALPKRCIELFDWSRANLGLMAERYPSHSFQASGTFALLFPLMVRDHLHWRDDPDFARQRLLGMRCQLEHFLTLTGPDGLLGMLPGWSFTDWVPAWNDSEGVCPGAQQGDSSIINLFFILSLQAHAEVEDAVGEPALAQRARDLAARAGKTVITRWWDDRRSLFADDSTRKTFSEHAQCLALIAGILDPARAQRCLDAWLAATDLAQATVYFSFYTLEALYRTGRGEELLRRLAFWKGLKAQGFTTTVEMPEPARSDCHAWGAHPLWHMQASLAGIRPAAPGFKRVTIAPCPGNLERIDATCPHPLGNIRVSWRKTGSTWSAEVELPPNTTGVWRFNGSEQALKPGCTKISGTIPR
ncbi:MAG: alpha-L-rhamnosidase C-terminal domain-containing protein [Planctomycetota bacterium]